jgi:diguanylate cyclase (GGDEF)-like protein/PAS domain S-box-containing protein
MELSAGLLKQLLEEVEEGVYFTDLQRRITFWNKGAQRISGYTGGDVLGKKCSDNILIHLDELGEPLCTGLCPLARTLADRILRQANVFLHHKDGHRIPVRIRVFPILDERQQVSGAAELFSDCTQKLDLQTRMQELQQLAMIDHLTGIANRRLMESYLETRLTELRRSAWPFGIIFFDIDDFKVLNDRYSHRIGDGALRMTAQSLQANIRSIDQVGRWGGEEFIVVLGNASLAALSKVAEKLRFLVEKSVFWGKGHPITVTVSGGATLAAAEDSVQSLIDRADRLMYLSKTSGKNRVRYG